MIALAQTLPWQRRLNVISLFIYHNGKTEKNLSDFIISFNLFGEFDNFADSDAAEEERREYENKKK